MTASPGPPGGPQATAPGLAAMSRRRRTIVIGAIVALLAIAAIAVVVFVVNDRHERSAAPPVDETDRPATALEDGGYSLGTDLVPGDPNDAAVTVEFLTDYICPYCLIWEEAYGETLTELAKAGTIDYIVHPIALLDMYSSGDSQYSTRASNAAALVAEYAPQQFYAYHQALFANQPHEGTAGLSNQQLAAIATEVGVSDETAARIASGTWEFADWVKSETEAVIRGGTNSTPHLYLNGAEWRADADSDLSPADQLTAAIAAAG